MSIAGINATFRTTNETPNETELSCGETYSSLQGDRMSSEIDNEIGKYIGELLFEMETKNTLDGKPLPSTGLYELDEWYTEIGLLIWGLAYSKYYKARYVPASGNNSYQPKPTPTVPLPNLPEKHKDHPYDA